MKLLKMFIKEPLLRTHYNQFNYSLIRAVFVLYYTMVCSSIFVIDRFKNDFRVDTIVKMCIKNFVSFKENDIRIVKKLTGITFCWSPLLPFGSPLFSKIKLKLDPDKKF